MKDIWLIAALICCFGIFGYSVVETLPAFSSFGNIASLPHNSADTFDTSLSGKLKAISQDSVLGFVSDAPEEISEYIYFRCLYSAAPRRMDPDPFGKHTPKGLTRINTDTWDKQAMANIRQTEPDILIFGTTHRNTNLKIHGYRMIDHATIHSTEVGNVIVRIYQKQLGGVCRH